MKTILLASLALIAAPALAETTEMLAPRETRTFSYPRAIGRVELDRDGVVGVAAPTSRSLRLTGLNAGEALLQVFARDGGSMGRSRISVAATAHPAGEVSSSPPFVAGEQVVAVDVQFAAVSSSTLKALGFNFAKLSGDLQGAVVSPNSLTDTNLGAAGLALNASAPIQNAFNLFLSAPNRGINAVLSALSANGLSELLAQPTLLVRSGEQASFLAGGEIPVPVPQSAGPNGATISIQYKEFGVRLSVAPFVLSKDHIVLKLAPEVSELDYASGVQLQGYVVPGLRRRSAETTVELGSGQSFVIAGLSYSSQSTTRDKTPLIGDIPVIGAFFRRQQSQKERQELVIVATPRLVGPTRAADLPPLPGSGGMDGRASQSPDIGPFGIVRP